jgi:hypothetical protein
MFAFMLISQYCLSIYSFFKVLILDCNDLIKYNNF